MYKLIIQDDEGKTTVVPLIRDELTIGRQEGNTIRLTERNVSRRHAKLHRGQESIIIEDLDSYNGVRVNGSRIQGKAEIKEADRVQIGDYLIEVKADRVASQATEEIAPLSKSTVPVPVAVSASEAATAPNGTAAAAIAVAPATHTHSSGNLSTEAAIATSAAPAVAPVSRTDSGEGNGRLVVLSTSMAGREFDLDKPAMVIGRTEENDLWVNHRSISRHHAKVVRENGHYAIVDLQSANGVRVNGEEYGKVELRRGDVVDLGHVRFRYVAPDEDFVFGRDAQAVDISAQVASGKGMWIGLVVLVLLGTGFLLFSGDDKTTKAGVAPEQPEPLDYQDVLPVVVMDAAPAEAPEVVPETTESLSTLLEKAVAARAKDDWNAMSLAARQALSIDPTNAQALAYAEQAEFESISEERYAVFHEAATNRQWANVAALFAAIDPASVYKIKGQQKHDALKSEYRTYQLQVAQKAARRGKCAEILQQAAQTPAEWPDVADAIREVSCKIVPTTPPDRTIKRPPPDVKPTATGPGYDEIMEEATAAVKDTQYGKGLKLCREALELVPGDQKATMTCVIASCNLKNSASAKKYHRQIKSATRRDGLTQICFRLGVQGFGGEEL